MSESCLLSLLHNESAIKAVPDNLMATAYEATNDVERAFYKQAIARHFALWGEGFMQKKYVQTHAQGFTSTTTSTPAPFTIIVCTANYAYPSALLAALMPALCAQTILVFFLVEELPEKNLIATHTQRSAKVWAPLQLQGTQSQIALTQDAQLQGTQLCVPTKKVHSVLYPQQKIFSNTPLNLALLCALELAGVQNIYTTTHATTIALFTKLIATCGQGRLLVLDEKGFFGPMALAATENSLPAHFLTGTPKYFTQPLNPTPLAFSLTLNAEHENIFLWPELETTWFYNRHVELGSE